MPRPTNMPVPEVSVPELVTAENVEAPPLNWSSLPVPPGLPPAALVIQVEPSLVKQLAVTLPLVSILKAAVVDVA